MKQERITEFQDVEEEIFSILTALETDIIRFVDPTNAGEQEKKFFSARKQGEAYEPRFSYLARNPLFAHFSINPEFEKIVRKLKAIEIEPEGFGQMLLNKKDEGVRRMELVRSIGGLDFTDRSIEYFGRPSRVMVREARDFLEDNRDARYPEDAFTAEDMAWEMRRALKRRGIKWKVQLHPAMSAKASVLNAHRLMKIREDAGFPKGAIPRLAVHEIDTHVFRFLNGKQQPYRVFMGGPWSRWQQTEEGLAVVNEEIFGYDTIPSLKEYAGRLVAVDYALSHSFSETFDMLCAYFSEKTAYRITQRVKRGTHRPAKPGAFTKDFYYFSGRKKVWKHLAEGNSIVELYYGKISIEETDFLDEIPELRAPTYLPKYRKGQIQKKLKGVAL